MEVSIDVVIPAHNQYALTDSCLRHLSGQTVPHQVTVYDDASTDGTSERLAADWPRVQTIGGSENIGFARACNAAAALGEGDVIVLLNNDVECRPTFLAELVLPLLADKGVGSVAAVMLQPGGQLIDSVGLTCDRTLAAFPRLQGVSVECAGSPAPQLVGPAGAGAAYRRSAWEQAGGLDERITAYMEDFDLALRLRAAGWRTEAAPDAIGVHLGSATYGHRSARQRLHGGFARGYLLRRYGVLRGRAAARTLITETIVSVADAALSHDLVAVRGRIAGFHAAGSLPRRPQPPADTIDHGIDFRRSLALRRGVYARSPDRP